MAAEPTAVSRAAALERAAITSLLRVDVRRVEVGVKVAAMSDY